VQLDRLALRLRRRRPWEAVDLGCRMVQTWWRPLMAAWLTAYVPAAIFVYVVLREHPVLAIAIMWWLKPLFDRVALEVLSRAVFGEVPGPIEVLRAVRDTPGIVASLTIYRLDPARSFNLPVPHLERLRGRAARERSRSLGRRGRGAAVWATIVYFHFELVVTLSFFGAIDLFTPSGFDRDFGLKSIFMSDESSWRQALAMAMQVATVSLIEPFYVASGFALYLNRRTQLEAWDLELTLRSIAKGDADTTRPRALAAALLAALVFALAAPPEAGAAEPDTAIKQVLTEPELQQYRDVKRYRWKTDREPQARENEARGSSGLPELIARVGRVLMWIAAFVGVALLLYYARRYVGAWAPELGRRREPPTVLFGFDVAPESLPADIAAAALAAIEAGRPREALGLLYRGALVALVTRDGLEVEPGDTEGDCVRRTAALVDAAKAQAFAELVKTWQATAYARREPGEPALRGLLASFREHFEPAAP
jgi:hypothetical protein